MRASWVKPKYVAGVVFLQFLELYAYNIQQSDSSLPDMSPQSITITDYSDKIPVQYSSPEDYDQSDQTSLDTWSVVWYIASFGGLILFFIIVSCSEWCCRRNARRNCQRSNTTQSAPQSLDTPPPSYDQFAPPAYEDLWVGSSGARRGEKSQYDIYVVPMDAFGTLVQEGRREDAPPSYQIANERTTHPTDLPQVHSSSGINRVT